MFQSHNGAIAAARRYAEGVQVARFNPTMVRLLLKNRGLAGKAAISFNPTMVRLLLKAWRTMIEEASSFNPTMVRLLPRQNFGV